MWACWRSGWDRTATETSVAARSVHGRAGRTEQMCECRRAAGAVAPPGRGGRLPARTESFGVWMRMRAGFQLAGLCGDGGARAFSAADVVSLSRRCVMSSSGQSPRPSPPVRSVMCQYEQ